MLECNRFVLDSLQAARAGSVDALSVISGQVVLEEGAEIVRSTIRGPVIIGRDTKIIDSYVGPFTSIYYGCLVHSTEIEHSIVLEKTVIRGMPRIEDSLIGRQVELASSATLPRAHRLMLGDHSRVSVVGSGSGRV